MTLMISVYTRSAYRDFRLPAVNNRDYRIHISRNYFGLSGDIHLCLDVMQWTWRLCRGERYHPDESGSGGLLPCPLQEGTHIKLFTEEGEEISLLVRKVQDPFQPFGLYSLAGKRITIGREKGCTICYNNMDMVGRRHAVICFSEGEWKVISQSRNGLYVNRTYVQTERLLRYGDTIDILGLRLVFLGDILAAGGDDVRVALQAYEGKPSLPPGPSAVEEFFHRSPRIIEKPDTAAVKIENPPKPVRQENVSPFLLVGPSITMTIPMMMSSFLMLWSARMTGQNNHPYMYSGILMAASSASIAVFWSLFRLRYQNRIREREEKERLSQYDLYLEKKEQEIQKIYEDSRAILNRMYPGPEEYLSYTADSSMLWNRNPGHEDFLSFRLGLGSMEFQAKIEGAPERFSVETDILEERVRNIRGRYKILSGVPVLVDLQKHPVVGITGGPEKKGAIGPARLLMAQAAAFTSFHDVRFALIYDKDTLADPQEWDFARWFPHMFSDDRKMRYIASDRTEAGEVFFALAEIFRRREERQSTDNKSSKNTGRDPYFILFIADVSMLENSLISKYVLNPGGGYGLTSVILTENQEQLPNACRFIICNDPEEKGIFDFEDGGVAKRCLEFDRTHRNHTETFARRLASLKTRELQEGGEIPSLLTFFDMYGITVPEELNVKERWLKNRIYESMRSLIGQKAGGVPLYLDLHEKYHGPHALLAGTTGSGKSETLETLILSLSVMYSPEDIRFFLIDFKGGGMANHFKNLPHLAGTISNLSGGRIRRAMISINSENRRRQKIFNTYGVNHINAYIRLYKDGEAEEPLPHLLIIIDEFAELKREEPEFMKELISVAQVGRSLGIHLVLATQKPGGTVDENIRSNTRSRICLRVQDRQDSTDMLQKPDAASLTHTGRAFLQVGNDECFELFQSGYGGAMCPEGVRSAKGASVRLISLTGREQPAASVKQDESLQKGSGKCTGNGSTESRKTQLEAVTEYLREAAAQIKTGRMHPLWLPFLPEHVELDDLFSMSPGGSAAGKSSVCVPTGLVDDPYEQRQYPYYIRLPENGNIGVIGCSSSGRSTWLQTLTVGIICTCPPSSVWIYVLDFGGGILDAFAGAPHIGGIIKEDFPDKITRLFHFLLKRLEERKKAFGGVPFTQVQEDIRAGFPMMLLLIDSCDRFRAKTLDAFEASLYTLAREGPSCGIFLIMTGEAGTGGISGRLAENLKTLLTLSLTDRYAYAEALKVPRVEILPEERLPGRGLLLDDHRVKEYQSAIYLGKLSSMARREKIEEICLVLAAGYGNMQAEKIPEIPKRPLLDAFRTRKEVRLAEADPALLPVGYDMQSGEVYSLEMRDLYCFLITGTRKSGKSNFMKILIAEALSKQSSVCLIGPVDCKMSGFENQKDLLYLSAEEEICRYFEQVLQPLFRERSGQKWEILMKGGDENAVFDRMKRQKALYICLPDLAWFVEMVNGSKTGMKTIMENLLDQGELHHIYWIGILRDGRKNIPGDLLKLFARDQRGIHFGGCMAGNSLLNFSYLKYEEQNKRQKAGIGQLSESGGRQKNGRIKIPLFSGREGFQD